MKDQPENELFSAYLDGELTAAEQAEVEQLLACSPAARQLLDELRTLSSKLQNLPQHALGEDLGPRVLQIAERRMLTQPASPGEPAEPAPRRAFLRRVLNPRALAWSALAVATAVMLTVINWQPQDRPAGDGIVKAKAPDETNRGERGGGRIPEIAAVPKAGEQPGKPQIAEGKHLLTAEGRDERPGGVAPSSEASLPTAPSVAKKGGSQLKDMDQPSPMPFKRQDAAPTEETPKGPSKGETPPGLHYAGKGGNGAGGRIAANGERTQVGKGGESYRGMKLAPGSRASLTGGRGNSPQLGAGQVLGQGQANLTGTIVQPVAGSAVVCCDISPRAFQRQSFDRVLAANGIALAKTTAEANVVDTVQTIGNDLPTPEQVSGQQEKQEQGQGVAGTTLSDLPGNGELDLVYVEATREQLEATLATLNAQPVEFLSVSVKPALGVEAQQDWGRRYGRGLQEKARRADGAKPVEADETADADAFARLGGLAQNRQPGEGENKSSLGYAWRYRLSEPVPHDRLYSQMGGLGGVQSDRAAGPSAPDASTSPATEDASRPPQRPVGPPAAEHAAQPAAPAELPPAPPPPARKRAEPSVPEGRLKEAPDAGEQSDGLPKAAKGGQAAPELTPQVTVRRVEQAAKPPQPGALQSQVPLHQQAPKPREGGQLTEEVGNQPAVGDEAEEKSGSRSGEERDSQRPKPERPQQPATTYRVLFVLRMARPEAIDRPTAAASMIKQGEPPATRVEPAEKR